MLSNFAADSWIGSEIQHRSQDVEGFEFFFIALTQMISKIESLLIRADFRARKVRAFLSL
jgi:hypothetical protein